MSRKAMRFRIPVSHLLKYCSCALLMALLLYYFVPVRELPIEIDKAVLQVLWPVILGGVVYFASLYIVDSHFRILSSNIFNWLKNRIRTLNTVRRLSLRS